MYLLGLAEGLKRSAPAPVGCLPPDGDREVLADRLVAAVLRSRDDADIAIIVGRELISDRCG